MKKRVIWNNVERWAIVLVLVGIIAGLAWFFTENGTETQMHTDETTVSSYINCNSAYPVDPFLSSDLSSNPNHELKVTFDEEGINTLSYTYTGNFANAKTAEDESSRLLSKYNTYMGQETLHKNGVLSPAFSSINEKLVINLFMSRKYLDRSTAKLVFLSYTEYVEIENTNNYKEILNKLKAFYQNKGFICEVKY